MRFWRRAGWPGSARLDSGPGLSAGQGEVSARSPSAF